MEIDNEFRNYIRPLSSEEYDKLEASILSEGIRDPLVIWQGILLDGYHRYKIAQEHGLEYKTVEVELPDKEAAKEWIITNQLGRRNLTEQEASYYRGKLYENRKLSRGGDRKSNTNNWNLKSTAEELSDQYDVSKNTIINDAKFSAAVDKVADEVGEEAKKAILSGKAKVPKKHVEKLIEVKQEAPEFIEPILNGEIEISKVVREINREKKIDSIAKKTTEAKALGEMGIYSVILADPPWRYDFSQNSNNSIECHYPTMSIEEICELPVNEIAYDDCVLFLWATNPKLEEAMQVINAWGFKYRTNMVWVKNSTGLGYYARQQHELLLIATKGNLPTPDPSDRVSSVIESPREKKSKKPDVVYEIIEKMYPKYNKIELFARSKRDGWSVWGNQV